jgi:6-phosphogluconolactonase
VDAPRVAASGAARNHREVVVDRPPALAEALAVRLEEEAAAAFAARDRFTVALPGGSVAEAFAPRLAALPVDWSRVELFWVDERAVPAEDRASNYGLALRLGLAAVGAPAARVHRMAGDAGDLDGAAASYERTLRDSLGEPPRLDVALLGVGEDGHVASLFPAHPLLAERRRLVAPVLDAPKPPPRRLTLTLPALLAARLLVIAAFGEAKAAAIGAALEDADSPLPVARLARGARRVLFLLDPPAYASSPSR